MRDFWPSTRITRIKQIDTDIDAWWVLMMFGSLPPTTFRVRFGFEFFCLVVLRCLVCPQFPILVYQKRCKCIRRIYLNEPRQHSTTVSVSQQFWLLVSKPPVLGDRPQELEWGIANGDFVAWFCKAEELYVGIHGYLGMYQGFPCDARLYNWPMTPEKMPTKEIIPSSEHAMLGQPQIETRPKKTSILSL